MLSIPNQIRFITVLFIAGFSWVLFNPYSDLTIMVVFLAYILSAAAFVFFNLRTPTNEWVVGWVARMMLSFWAFAVLTPAYYSPSLMMVAFMIFKMLAVVSYVSGRTKSLRIAVVTVAPIIVMYAAILFAFLADTDLQHNFDVLYNLQIMATVFIVLLAVEQVADSNIPRVFSYGNLANSGFVLIVEYLQILPSAAFILQSDQVMHGWSVRMLLLAIILATYMPLVATMRLRLRPPVEHAPETTHVNQMSIILEWTVWIFPLFIVLIGSQSTPMTKQIMAIGTLVAMGLLTGRFRRLRSMLETTNRELSRMASYDKLTGVFNRLGLHEEWDARQTGSNTMLFIDLDKFKPINDEHGHLVGDEVLITTAKRIRRTIRNHDAVGRVGGDEFVVICPTLTDTQAHILMDRIRANISRPIMLDASLRLQLDASIGYTQASPQAPFAKVINRADIAMYEQKVARKTIRDEVEQPSDSQAAAGQPAPNPTADVQAADHQPALAPAQGGPHG